MPAQQRTTSISEDSSSSDEAIDALYDNGTFPAERKEPTAEEMELFRQQVAEWLKIDDTVRKLKTALRERRVHQRALAEKVQSFMIRHGYDNLNTQAGVIRASTRTVRQPLKIGDIREKLLALGDTPLAPEEIINRILDAERPTTVRQSLRRIVPRVSLALDL